MRFKCKMQNANCKMSKNAQFFEHIHLNFAQSANTTPKILYIQNQYGLSKNAEFHTDSRFVEIGSKNLTLVENIF